MDWGHSGVTGVPSMCDYSLDLVASRPAKVGDKLVSTSFPETTTRGFASVDDRNVAVCLLPGTELAWEDAAILTSSMPALGIAFTTAVKVSDMPTQPRRRASRPWPPLPRWCRPCRRPAPAGGRTHH